MDGREHYNGQLEVGFTDVLRKHPTVHLAVDHAGPAPVWLMRLERKRPQILRELCAEAFGFLWSASIKVSQCGLGAQVSFGLTTVAGLNNFGSLLQVAFGYAFGIAFALIIGATTSGGHFNPAITIVFATLQGFPWRKVPLFIVAQVFGAFMASLIIYAQWHSTLAEVEAATRAAGGNLFTSTGLAGLFIAIPNEGQPLGNVFLNEFFADSFIGMVIWAVLDGNNLFIKPAGAPFVIGLAYFSMIGAFGSNTLSTNLARDLGARMVVAIFYGKEAFLVRAPYVAIPLLTSFPATMFGVLVYQFVCGDTAKLLRTGKAVPKEIHEELVRERANNEPGEVGPIETYLKKHPTVREDYPEQYVNGNGQAKVGMATKHV